MFLYAFILKIYVVRDMHALFSKLMSRVRYNLYLSVSVNNESYITSYIFFRNKMNS